MFSRKNPYSEFKIEESMILKVFEKPLSCLLEWEKNQGWNNIYYLIKFPLNLVNKSPKPSILDLPWVQASMDVWESLSWERGFDFE